MRLLRSHARRHWGALAGAAAVDGRAHPRPARCTVAAEDRDRPAGDRTGHGLRARPATTSPLLLGLAALVLGIAMVDALATFYSDFWLNRSGEQIVHDLRTATYEHLQRLSLVFHSNRPTGDLVARVTGDVNAVGDLFAQTLGTLASVVARARRHVRRDVLDRPAAGVRRLPGHAAAAGDDHALPEADPADGAQRSGRKEGEIASLATEALSAMQVIKAFGTERFEHDRVQRRSAERLKVGVESSRVEARFGALVDVLGAVATALVLVLGVLSVADGRISPGDLVVVVSYTNKLYKPLKDIAKQASRAARVPRPARAHRRDPVLRHGAGRRHRRLEARTTAAAGTIDLDDVHFRYTEDRAALNGVTLHVPKGSRLALVGESGAGKSTVGALVARFYDPCARLRPDRRPRRAGAGRCAGCATRSVSCCRTRSCSAAASGTTSPTGPTPTSRRSSTSPGQPARSRSSRPCPTGFDTLLGPGGRGPLRRPAPADRHRARPAARPTRARAGRADHRSGRRERGAGDGRAATD